MRSLLPTVLAIGALAVPGLARGQTPGDAYLDAAAAAMVAGARAGTDSVNSRITAYEMVARQRISVGLATARRDRLVYRREVASRVTWTRSEGRRVEVIGAREAVPLVLRSVRAVDRRELRSLGADLPLDPMAGWLLRVPGAIDDDLDETLSEPDADGDADAGDPENVGRRDRPARRREGADPEGGDVEVSLVHPLARGSEAHYRFRSGDTTVIRLADGRSIRLVELQVLPRRAAPDLLSGSFWLDAETNAPVRGVFGLAAPLRWTIDLGIAEIGVLDATTRYLTVEYGLWEGRYWLPRLIAFEGSASVGRLSFPVTFEQTYEDFRIHSAERPWPGFAEPDTTSFHVMEIGCEDDSDDCEPRTVLVPRDTVQLVESDLLPPSIYGRESGLVTVREVRDAVDVLGVSRWRGLFARRPNYYWRPLDFGLVHYNRVEGLTLGTTAGVEFGPLAVRGSLWFGIADGSPSFSVDVVRSRVDGEESLGVHRRVEAFSPADTPFSIGNSFSALAMGRDDGDYYRAMGVGATTRHEFASNVSVTLNAYVERQTPLEKNTDASIANWTGGRLFRENPAADEADQVGGLLAFRWTHGLDPAGFRLALETGVLSETGTFRFVRPAAAVRTTFPLPGRFLGAVDLAGGTAFGELPAQRNWYVGGRGTVRGVDAEDRLSGEAFWSARAELGTEFPGARLVAFGDAGWAGPTSAFTADPDLASVGIGFSVLDGLMRIDVARVVRGPSGWSVQGHLDAPL